MSYTLNYYSSSNTNVVGGTAASAITVPDGQSQTVANLTFPGRNFSGYGSPVDQNFLSLVENFASANTTGPGNPIVGQLWYDTANTSNANISGLKVKTSQTGNVHNWTMIATKSNDGSMSVAGNLIVSGNSVNFNSNVTIGNTGSGNTRTLTVNGDANISSSFKANTGNFTTSLVTPNANITTANITTATLGFTTVSDNVVINGSNINVTSTSSKTVFWGDVDVKGKFTAPSGNSTILNQLAVTSAIFSVGDVTGGNGNVVANTIKDLHGGVRIVYYTANASSNTSGITKNAFIGYLPSSSTFLLASDVDATAIAGGNVTNPVLGGTLSVGAITAANTITATTFNGVLANGTSNVSIPSSGGNVNISVGNTANVLVANSTTVKITGSAATSTTTGALQVSGGVGITGDLYVAGNISGKIGNSSSNLVGSTANLTTIYCDTLVANVSLSTKQSLTVNSTATIGTLNVNTDAKVNNLTANVNLTVGATSTLNGDVSVADGKTLTVKNITSGGTGTKGILTGQWTLDTGSTLEATYSADLAERHHADATYPTGTVMTVGGTNEITAANEDSKVLGVVSDQWAYLMNGGAGPQETHPAVAYVGRVPVRVVGPVNKHDEVSPFKNGVATASRSNSFGWALETNLEAGEKLVLCIVK